MINQKTFRLIAIFALCLLTLTAAAQTRRGKKVKKSAPPTTTTIAAPETAPTPPSSGKKNSRPDAENNIPEVDAQPTNTSQPQNFTPVYFYEFSQSAFATTHIVIEHDETGKGKITLRKKDLDEDFEDPIQLSPATLEKLKTSWTALNFLDATEDYQSTVRDYPHLGTIKLRMKKDNRTREAEFNWTENPDAKIISDEYKKLSYQFVWQFDMSVARVSLPLDAPRVMRQMDGYLKRNEVSDPPSLIPYLRELSDDERIPLIARNAATRMIADIEKKAAKK